MPIEYEILRYTLNGKIGDIAYFDGQADFIDGDTRTIRYLPNGEPIDQTFQGPTDIGGWFDND